MGVVRYNFKVMTDTPKLNLTELANEIETITTMARARVVEMRDFFVKNEALLASREDEIVAVQKENELSKTEIFNDTPSPEFIATLEREVGEVRQEITAMRQVIASLDTFSKQFEEQVISLLELDKKMTEALLAYKFLRKSN